jgi:hypothetical protein
MEEEAGGNCARTGTGCVNPERDDMPHAEEIPAVQRMVRWVDLCLVTG